LYERCPNGFARKLQVGASKPKPHACVVLPTDRPRVAPTLLRHQKERERVKKSRPGSERAALMHTRIKEREKTVGRWASGRKGQPRLSSLYPRLPPRPNRLPVCIHVDLDQCGHLSMRAILIYRAITRCLSPALPLDAATPASSFVPPDDGAGVFTNEDG
jgi:hypothetical protein